MPTEALPFSTNMRATELHSGSARKYYPRAITRAPKRVSQVFEPIYDAVQSAANGGPDYTFLFPAEGGNKAQAVADAKRAYDTAKRYASAFSTPERKYGGLDIYVSENPAGDRVLVITH